MKLNINMDSIGDFLDKAGDAVNVAQDANSTNWNIPSLQTDNNVKIDNNSMLFILGAILLYFQLKKR